MRNFLVPMVAAASLALPPALAGQVGLAARVGTLGIGAEAALGVGGPVVLRGGLGWMPIEVDPTSFWDVGDEVDANLKLPEAWYNVGIDLYLGGPFRLGGGLLYKPDDLTLTASLAGTATIDIDGQTYTASEVSRVTGALDSRNAGPYVLIGFGRHTSPGFGLFVDLGLALLGEPDVVLAAEGNPTLVNSAEFQARLRAEEQSLEDDAPTYLRFWPILNVGVRFGIG